MECDRPQSLFLSEEATRQFSDRLAAAPCELFNNRSHALANPLGEPEIEAGSQDSKLSQFYPCLTLCALSEERSLPLW
jgi:hypothetical protein